MFIKYIVVLLYQEKFSTHWLSNIIFNILLYPVEYIYIYILRPLNNLE